MAHITNVVAREILDSRGDPTVEVSVTLDDGSTAQAGVPSGKSTGAFEAVELRDHDERRYHGMGVLQAVNHVNTLLAPAVIGLAAENQPVIDKTLCALDGTPNKARLGANAILGVSLAVCRAAALSLGRPLHEHIAMLYGKKEARGSFPIPMFNIVNGGKHADSGLSVQEFKIIPFGIKTFPEQLRAGSEIFHALARILEQRGLATSVGDEGGFAPRLESHAQALEVIGAAITDAGYRVGEDVFIGLDVAADSFFDNKGDQYLLKPEGVALSRESLVNLYREWMSQYAVVSIEDGLHEEDWDGWASMKEKLEKEETAWKQIVMLIGDDLLVTNVERLKKAIEKKACNAVLIKVNQIGTISETLDCMRLAHEHGMNRVISHRSGETVDDFIADLAVGTGAEFIKSGSLSRGERLAKYNRLSEIFQTLN
ncbi:MAG: phosphopyruvate hydratase [Candidatus Moranbacteria bacterium]|nr:phosphopyruvate hydratase [Candidatus Moranbacteria bacterium]